ncbi:MAG: YbjQ family protein [Kiritimatiellaeota bacterium]|nr:YbjQ family protein [Kiritimatiellota bacterium]
MEKEVFKHFVFVVGVILPLALVPLWFLLGRWMENRHLRDLARREQAAAGMLRTSLGRPGGMNPRQTPTLVIGETVVASDKFKTFLFAWRNVIGGESKTFTRLYARARREATLRMLEEAERLGYNAVCNVRYDAVDIAGNTMNRGKQQQPMAVCMAVGTAYLRD